MSVFDDLKSGAPDGLQEGAPGSRTAGACCLAGTRTHAFIRAPNERGPAVEDSSSCPRAVDIMRVIQTVRGQMSQKCLLPPGDARSAPPRRSLIPARPPRQAGGDRRASRDGGTSALGSSAGFGLQHGALAVVRAHDSHNLCCWASDGRHLKAAQAGLTERRPSVVLAGRRDPSRAGAAGGWPGERPAAGDRGCQSRRTEPGGPPGRMHDSRSFAVLSFLSWFDPGAALTDKGLMTPLRSDLSTCLCNSQETHADIIRKMRIPLLPQCP